VTVPRRNLLLLLPPLIFAAFAALAFVALKRENPDELPSALAGRQAPSLAAADVLGDLPRPTDADLRAGQITLVNFWASWCGPCRIEHPVLTELSAAGATVIGVNYKDKPEQALGFLDSLGDPYRAIAADTSGRIGLDWGIYGVPETFVIDGKGVILLRHPGPLTPQIVAERIAPLLGAGGAGAKKP
jgi:cytochrome c biogenesis protein CcmG/thiol:disulfide interchange protein DsbE